MSGWSTVRPSCTPQIGPVALVVLAVLAGCQRGRIATPPAPAAVTTTVARQIHRAAFSSADLQLTVEVLDDDLVRLGLAASSGSQAAAASPFVVRRAFPGPSRLTRDGDTLTTPELRLSVDRDSLSVTVEQLREGGRRPLTTFSPLQESGQLAGVTMARASAQHVYGLGEQFGELGQPDGTWIGKRRGPGNEYGNRMVPYHGGAVGNTQIPIMYALGPGSDGYALFMDHAEAITWDFTADPWRARLSAPRIQWYLLAGPDLPDLRADYMELVGRPLVPPKKAFGLWVSEYGYRDWDHISAKLKSLRDKRFPVDGFVLDLFWFGGIKSNSPESSMGALTWDTSRFPEPARRIGALREEGVGIMVIEESYVSRKLPEYDLLRRAGYLARKCAGCEPVTFTAWWGAGGMIDWTAPVGAAFWHDYKRAPLVRDGVMGHWTDLGEPETFAADAWYHGIGGRHDHAAVANLYNFMWLQSIHEGYRRQRSDQRPFILSRSGGPGVQRFGAAMWSGDIASNLASLRSHMNVQLHMSLSGIDYFGADIGGFNRHAVRGDVDEMYTQWLACGAAVDVPVRPHANNLERIHQTAPDRIGDVDSNRKNLRRRYRLAPYLYSAAHRAHQEGVPVFPPPVFYYQDDPAVRELGSQKMIGRDLMVALVAKHGATHTDVYLPRGTWYAYRDGARITSRGELLKQVPLRADGQFTLPLYARAGAIIPELPIPNASFDSTGSSAASDAAAVPLVARVFPGAERTETTLFEDDGRTTAYLDGALRTTRIEQVRRADALTLIIHPARGSYAGAPATRPVEVLFVCPGCEVAGATVDGKAVPRAAGLDAAGAAAPGWSPSAGGTFVVRSGPLPTGRRRTIALQLAR